jgi:hypothetical protein
MSKELNLEDFVKLHDQGDKIFCIVHKENHPPLGTLYRCIGERGRDEVRSIEWLTVVDIVPEEIKLSILANIIEQTHILLEMARR